MLAYDPTQRVSLGILQIEDPWVTEGPNRYRMPMSEYKETMDECFAEIVMKNEISKDNKNLLPISSNEDPTADRSHQVA